MNICVQGIIDTNIPEIKAMQEMNLRRKLMEEIEGVLFNGENHVVKIKRHEHKERN